MGVTLGRQAEGRQSNFQLQKKEDAMKLKNLAVVGLVLVGAVGAVISFMVFAAIITGTPYNDYFDDSIPGICGPIPCSNDVIRTLAGDDFIRSTNGNDRIDAGEDDDQIEITTLRRAYVVGGPGNDVIDAQAGTNHRIFGNDGDDNILIGIGVLGSRVDAGDGNDVIDLNASAGNHVVYGGYDDDEIEAIGCGGTGIPCNLKIYGGPGQDNITVGFGSNFIEPGEDADVVVAGTAAGSNDIISIRVGDVPIGETEKITCTVSGNATTTIILTRSSLGVFPRGTPTSFDASGVLTIIDPAPAPRGGGVYEIRRGPGNCIIVRR
jgi:Ca2+-binding RTX toxin-like protein